MAIGLALRAVISWDLLAQKITTNLFFYFISLFINKLITIAAFIPCYFYYIITNWVRIKIYIKFFQNIYTIL
jgi:hypothetical protein